MEKFLQSFIKNVVTLPIWLQIILIIIILIIVFSKYLYPIIKSIRKKSKRKSKKVKKINKDLLLSHDYFTTLDKIINYDIKNKDFGSKGKKYIAKMLLEAKIDSFIKNTETMIKNMDLNVSVNECKRIVLNNIYSSIDEYETIFLKNANTNEERTTLKYVLKKFNETHLKNGEQIIASINDRIDNETNITTYDRLCFTLDMMIVPFDFLTNDIENIFKEMNGDLKGKKIHDIEI